MQKLNRTLLAAVLAIFPGTRVAALAGPGPGEVAIIVNLTNGVDNISSKELKQIFAGEKGRWQDGDVVLTVSPASTLPEHKTAIKFLYGMTEEQFGKYRLQAGFVGDSQKVPKEYASPARVMNLVAIVPGAIGFVPARLVPDTVKVLKIDGKSPGDPGYALAASK